MLRRTILAAARSSAVRRAVVTAPPTRAVVDRFVAGEDVDDAVAACRRLTADGLHVTLDRLGEFTRDAEVAAATAKAYVVLLDRLAAEGLTARCEVSVKLSAVGQQLDERMALDHARSVCAAAAAAGTTVTLDMEDHTTTDSTLAILGELRRDFPDTGAVIQSYLRRSEGDCRDLARPGSRVRLCKGAYDEPESVAYRTGREVDLSYVRCLRVLMDGGGYPMVATHDPHLIGVADALVRGSGRGDDTYEYQMLHGVRPAEQRRLAGRGHTVRVYVPYGAEWYGYLMRRLAERPANVVFFLRSLVSTS